MPEIESLTMRSTSGRRVQIEIAVRWTRSERTTDYELRFEFWEEDSGGRGSDDRLTPMNTFPFSVPLDSGIRPEIERRTFLLQGDSSWNNEVGKDEVYCVATLYPHPDSPAPQTTSARSNVIAKRF